MGPDSNESRSHSPGLSDKERRLSEDYPPSKQLNDTQYLNGASPEMHSGIDVGAAQQSLLPELHGNINALPHHTSIQQNSTTAMRCVRKRHAFLDRQLCWAPSCTSIASCPVFVPDWSEGTTMQPPC